MLNKDKIDHVVVLMLENRSFDCMLGRLYNKDEKPDFEGVPAGASNFANGVEYPAWTSDPGDGTNTFFIPTPDGIYFRNNQGSLKMKGKVVYRWVESLAPYLNGEHSLSQITSGLDSEKQKMVTDLVDTLLKQGFLKDLSQDLPHHLSQTERETYAAEIAFIDSFCDSAASRFERFRERQVLLIGSGLTLTGLMHASLNCGLRQVAVITTPECETNTRRHQEYLNLFRKIKKARTE